MKELSPQYNPKQTEDRIYKLWQEALAFQPKVDPDKKPFCIVIPPPNITGSLHMGHALNNTIQDILIRRSRMKGGPTLWVPGTDHAGIATQNVVEKALQKEGKSRHDLGREEFIKRVWQWVDEYGHIITDQLKKMGCSCDWTRERFTMDEGYSEAVKAAFKHYYDKGLIYQGERVINWCVRCQTALSDIELEYKEVPGKLWFIKYGDVTVATTRPETMLGDTAVAVNPKDKRYEKLIGKTVILPLLNREIPIIADDAVDMKFGTGAVKVTPAHDMNDFEIWTRNKEKIGKPIRIIDETGIIAFQERDYVGQKALEARENILNDLRAENLIEKEENYLHEVPHCYRCGRQVEQLISKQWFVKMSELIKPAIEAIKNDEIKITPTRWKKVYLDWMENIKDWCISRQIWWGHRLPVWQSEVKSKNEKVKTNEAELYIGNNPPKSYIQSSDVLDTWFSSALWPIAVFLKKNGSNVKLKNAIDIFGEDLITEDLAYFYPTSVLSTARDINMLWVVRMIFSGYEFMGEKPFEQVYIHPTIFNIEGKRMSKSLGTGIDPLELIEKYGADAVRFGLTYINTGTQDIKFDENAILAGKKFANKIWNVARFTILQMQNSNLKSQNDKSKFKIKFKTDADKTILEKLDNIIKSTEGNFDEFRFGQAAHDLYDFVWHDLADEYIEKSKSQISNLSPKAGMQMKENTQQILLYILVDTLKLLHPIMPFITEEIWQILKENNLAENNLITAKWPG